MVFSSIIFIFYFLPLFFDEFKPDLLVMQMADRYLHLAPLKPVGFDKMCGE